MMVNFGDQKFELKTESNLLEVLRSTDIPRGCLKGVCRVCKCQLMQGSVMVNGRQVEAPNEILPCVAEPIGDVWLKPSELKLAKAKVTQISKLDKNIIEIRLVPKKSQFFNSKSIINIKHPDSSEMRSYSLVSLPNASFNELIFQVKIQAEGLFSSWFKRLREEEEVSFKILTDSLPIYDNPIENIVVVAGGSGMGAALSRGIDLVKKCQASDVQIYAINRAELSQYHHYCVEEFRAKLPERLQVTNVHFADWVAGQVPINVNQQSVVVSVGSQKVTDIVLSQNLTCATEIESFG